MTDAQGSDDLRAALYRIGLGACRIEPLSARPPSPGGRATFLVRLAGGGLLKARRLEDERSARAQQRLRALLPAAFVAVLARDGAVLFEPWIVGRPLAGERPDSSVVRAAGRLLATLHGLTSVPYPLDLMRLYRDTVADLSGLAAAGVLAAGEAVALGVRLEAGCPRSACGCLIHTDLCGENLVLDGAGRLFVVDNEHIRIGPPGMDLARTWYRWGLRGPAWEAFATAYRAGGGAQESFAHQSFWRIAAVTISAGLRLRTRHPDLAVPVRCLRSLLCADPGEVLDA